MLAEMPVERRAVRIRQRLSLTAEDPARASLQVADAQRRQLGSNQAGQALKDGSDEGCAARALLGKRLQRAQGGAQVALSKLCKHRGHETIQSKFGCSARARNIQ